MGGGDRSESLLDGQSRQPFVAQFPARRFDTELAGEGVVAHRTMSDEEL